MMMMMMMVMMMTADAPETSRLAAAGGSARGVRTQGVAPQVSRIAGLRPDVRQELAATGAGPGAFRAGTTGKEPEMFLYNAVSGCFSRPDPTDPSRLITRLPAGAYTVESITSFMPKFRPMQLNAEPLYPVQSYHLYYMKREIQRFFDQKITRRLAQSGIKHRRGVLLYGPPGTGKTSLVRQVIPLLVERDAVILKN
jgi:hypothetical protein